MSLSPSQEISRQAVDVLWLLHWAFVREKVHLARMPGLGASGAFAARGWPGSSSSERIGAAVGSSMNLGFEAPRDAYAVLEAVKRCGAAAVVREFALTGSVPDWKPYPVVRVVQGKTGHALHIDKRGKRTLCPFRLFTYSGDVAAVVEQRRKQYGVWAKAIAGVHAALSREGAMVRYVLLPDLPPLSPWGD